MAAAAILVIMLKGSMVEANQIISGSMTPTLLEGDFILVNKLRYGLHIPFMDKMVLIWSSPNRGDVVTFVPPEGFERKEGKVFVKRVVAVSGDMVEIKDSRLFINGQPVPTSRSFSNPHEFLETIGERSYNVMKLDPASSFGPYTVPESYVFAVGDNRDNSLDSRAWGPLPVKNIEGKAFLIYFSKAWRSSLDAIQRIGSLL